MATTQLPFNPLQTTNASGLFGITSGGFVQGVALPDASSRNYLMTATLNPAETLVMYGGVGIYEQIPGLVTGLGARAPKYVGRATSVTAQAAKQLTGFSVFNQATAYLNTPSSIVPTVGSNGTVAYFRFGSNIRIPVACAPALAASLDGGINTALVSWDYNAQQLVPYVAAYPANVLTGTTWASTNGGQVTFTTTTSHGVAVGDYFTISGSIPTGYNGDYIAITGTSGSTLVAALTANPGSITTEGTLVAGGGALPIRAIESISTNGKSVFLNSSGGYSWNTNATIAVIQL
jgi:hypothetical protein